MCGALRATRVGIVARPAALGTVIAATAVGIPPVQNVVVLRAGPGLLGLLHVTLLRRSIPQMTVSSSDTDQFDLPPADDPVSDMIRIPGGTHAEAINTSTSVSGLVASCAGGLAMEADSSR